MPFLTFLRFSLALALGFVIKLGHSIVTNAHRVIPRDAVHRPCVSALPTSPSARTLESARAGGCRSSSQRVGAVQRDCSAVVHAIARSNPDTRTKKCELLFARATHEQRGQHELHAHSSAVGTTATDARKLFQLRNHNDAGGRTAQALPKETLVTG